MLVRDSFVTQYLKDYNPYRACIRAGFVEAFALEWGRKFMTEGYVLRQIAYREAQAKTEAEAGLSEEEQRAYVESNLVELMKQGSTASRVAATNAFIAFKGWNKQEPTGDEAVALIEALQSFATRAPA